MPAHRALRAEAERHDLIQEGGRAGVPHPESPPGRARAGRPQGPRREDSHPRGGAEEGARVRDNGAPAAGKGQAGPVGAVPRGRVPAPVAHRDRVSGFKPPLPHLARAVEQREDVRARAPDVHV